MGCQKQKHAQKIPVLVSKRDHNGKAHLNRTRILTHIPGKNRSDMYSSTVQIALTNCRSLFCKFDEAVETMSLLELDAFIITETWQRETDLEKLICENALNLSQIGFLGLPRQNNSKKKGGGVGLLYQTLLNCVALS